MCVFVVGGGSGARGAVRRAAAERESSLPEQECCSKGRVRGIRRHKEGGAGAAFCEAGQGCFL